MKKILFIFGLTLLLALFTGNAFAQTTPPPPPSNPSNISPGPVGGGSADIGGGLILLLIMGVGYAFKRYYDVHRKVDEV